MATARDKRRTDNFNAVSLSCRLVIYGSMYMEFWTSSRVEGCNKCVYVECILYIYSFSKCHTTTRIRSWYVLWWIIQFCFVSFFFFSKINLFVIAWCAWAFNKLVPTLTTDKYDALSKPSSGRVDRNSVYVKCEMQTLHHYCMLIWSKNIFIHVDIVFNCVYSNYFDYTLLHVYVL